MSNSILVINSSPLGDHSVSRKLVADTLTKIKEVNPNATIVERDLTVTPAPQLSGMTIGAFHTPPDQLTEAQHEALAQSNELIEEVSTADVIVIAVPMWNFGIPASLKAWIDQVVRPGSTFTYGANGPEGLLPAGKKVILVTTRGGVYSSGPLQPMDFQETYMNSVLGFIGLKDISIVRAEGVGMGDEATQAAMQTANAQLEDAIKQLA